VNFPYVADQSQKDVGILGWLMEVANAGDLELAEMVFRNVSKELDDLIELE